MAKAKRIRGLDCNAPASKGVRLVLLSRFAEFDALHDAALDWSDPEGVHSMRVASRRLRGALRDFMPYLPKRGLTSVQKQLKSVADALGDVRDQDVFIMALEKLETHAPAAILPVLKKFIEMNKERRDQARRDLESIFEKGQLTQLEKDFIDAVDAAIATQERKMQRAKSPTPIVFAKMSRAIVLERLKELENVSNALFRPFDIEGLHEMRIAAKRLRYALELFQECWGRALGSYAKRVARMQSALGEVHDCDVWIESFGKQISAARKQKEHEQVAAFVWLLNHFIKLRTKPMRQALARWREWEAQDMSGKVRASLKTGEGSSVS